MTVSPLNRYAAALLHIGIAIVGAFVLLPGDTFAEPSTGIPGGLSLLAVTLSAVALYWAPLVGVRESSILKVAAAVGGSVIAALIEFVAAGDYSSTAIGFLALGVLSGIAAKVGSDIRKDAEILAATPGEITILGDAPRHLAG